MTLIETTIETFAARLTKVGEAMDLVIAAKDENVRPAFEALAEQLIAFLDATAPDPDLEEEPEGDGYADDEPSLGASDGANQERTWSLQQNSTDDREEQNEDGDELDKLEASDLEICGESDTDRMGSTTVDDEPSLGSLDGRMSQKRWGLPDRGGFWEMGWDREFDPAEQEGGIEDQPHDETYPWTALEWGTGTVQEAGLTGPPIGNANKAFGVVD
jgi:hypothetical protein